MSNHSTKISRAINKLETFFCLFIFALLGGCNSQCQLPVTRLPNTPRVSPNIEYTNLDLSFKSSHTLMTRNVKFSLGRPPDAELKIQLVSIAEDSTTTISLDSGQMLTATPGECFSCEQFGRSGLRLVSASHKTGEALFVCTRCE